jgi:hypothetical protein
VYNVSYLHIVEILLTLAAMSSPKSNTQVRRTTSKALAPVSNDPKKISHETVPEKTKIPNAKADATKLPEEAPVSNDAKEILYKMVLEKEKIANAKEDAIKSLEKVKVAYKSAIEMGTTISLATKKPLATIDSTLGKATKWADKLIESSNVIATKIMTKDEIDADRVFLTVALVEAKVEAQDTLVIAQQSNTLTQSIAKDATSRIAHLVKIALKAGTTAAEKITTWFRIAATAEEQGMKAAEALPVLVSSINRTRAKRAASDASEEVMEAQYATATWGKMKQRAEKTMEAWNRAIATIENTAQVISKAAEQMKTTFDAITEADVKRKKWIHHRNDMKNLAKNIIKTTTLAKHIISDAVEQIKACKRRMERAAESTTKLQTLMSSQAKSSFGIHI